MEEKIWSGALWVFQQSSVGSFWNCSQTSTPTSFCIPLSASLFCQACPFLFLPFPTPRWMLQPLGRCGAGWWTTCHGEGLSPGTLNQGVDSDSVGTNAAYCSECVMLAPRSIFGLMKCARTFLHEHLQRSQLRQSPVLLKQHQDAEGTGAGGCGGAGIGLVPETEWAVRAVITAD